jgi:hypothetical protein
MNRLDSDDKLEVQDLGVGFGDEQMREDYPNGGCANPQQETRSKRGRLNGDLLKGSQAQEDTYKMARP